MPNDAIINVTPTKVQKMPKNLSKRTLMIIGGALVALLLLGGSIWWVSNDSAGEIEAVSASSSSSYIEVPGLTVNLRGADGSARFLKLRFIIVAADTSNVSKIKDQLPALLDALQPFLRELRPEDLAGSAAVFRIKEEMMARATQTFGAGVVRDVLIQDLLQQ